MCYFLVDIHFLLLLIDRFFFFFGWVACLVVVKPVRPCPRPLHFRPIRWPTQRRHPDRMVESSADAYYEQEEISIDGDSASDGYVSEDSYYDYDAEAEWEESKAQLNALFSLVILPFLGKWLGKKASFWCKLQLKSYWENNINRLLNAVWTRYMSPLDSSPSSIFSIDWLNSLKRIAQ